MALCDLCLNKCTASGTLILSFTALTNFQGNFSEWALNAHGWVNLRITNRRSRKRFRNILDHGRPELRGTRTLRCTRAPGSLRVYRDDILSRLTHGYITDRYWEVIGSRQPV